MLTELVNKLVAEWRYAIVFALFALLQSFAVLNYLQAPISLIFADAFGFAVLYFALTLLIQNAIQYGKFQQLPKLHEMLIYTALITLSLIVLYASATALYQLFSADTSLVFSNFLPIRMLLSLLVLSLILQHCQQNKNYREPTTESEQTLEAPLQSAPTIELDPAANKPAELLQRVTVKSGSKIQVIATADIISLQADGDYVHIYTLTGKYMKEQTMKYFDENLPNDQFARVHRSCIVNIHAIARIELYDKQSQQLTLKNGQQVKVSQAGYKLLRSKLNL